MALLLADARLPTGGHAQSAGLEPALLGGLKHEEIPAFLQTRLGTTVRIDAAAAVIVLRGAAPDEVADAWAARTPSEVVRAAALEAGRGYVRLAASLDLPSGALPRDTPRPIALGALGRDLCISAEAMARVVCHDDLQAVCAAALKLAPTDPAVPVRWLLECRAAIAEVVDEVSQMTHPDQIPCATAPLLELWQHAHHHASRRLFRA